MEQDVHNESDKERAAAIQEGKYRAEPLWFFQRGDGEIIAAKAQEANSILYDKSEWRRHDFTLIGYSDGRAYEKELGNIKQKTAELKELVRETSGRVSRLLATKEKFLFEDLLNPKDEKVIRAEGLIKEAEAEYEDARKQLSNVGSALAKQAFNAELEVAKENVRKLQEEGKKVPSPKGVSVITPHADEVNRQRVLNAMGQKGMI